MNNDWSRIVSCFLYLAFYCFLLFLGSYQQYEITFIPLIPTLWLYSNLIVSHAFPITFLLTMSNLMLYIL